MADLFSITNFVDLAVLLFLQIVLGFDNLLYISIESKRAPPEYQARVRQTGILIAVAARIVLLFVMIQLIEALEAPFVELMFPGIAEGAFNFSSVVFLFGGGFIMYTAVREIGHLLAIDDFEAEAERAHSLSARTVVTKIVVMNLIFSFDSILSALAITKVFFVLAAAIIISGLGMLVMADRVSAFITKNRKYEVLGLFILLIVGVVLLGEGGHVAHLKLFDFPVEPLSKTTFYFSIAVLVLVDVLQSRYQKKLDTERLARRKQVMESQA